MAQKKTKNEVYSSLIEQLETMGAAQDHYIDLINDYMDLWNVKTKLFQHIKKRDYKSRFLMQVLKLFYTT